MKTIYLFIIILAFSMPTQCAFACGGGDGGAGSSDITTTNTRATVPYHVSGNTTRNSSNIWDKIREQAEKHRTDPNKADKDIEKLQRRLDEENARKRIAKENAKPNKKVDELIHQMRIRALLGDDPNALKNLDHDINRIGKRGVATFFVLELLGGGMGF